MHETNSDLIQQFKERYKLDDALFFPDIEDTGTQSNPFDFFGAVIQGSMEMSEFGLYTLENTFWWLRFCPMPLNQQNQARGFI